MRLGYLVLISLLCIFINSTFASQAPPAPVCEVEAEVLNLKEVEYCDNVATYATLLTDIKIVSTGATLGAGDQPTYKDFKCSSYQGQIIKGVRIALGKELKAGQKISGALSYFADENWQGNVLDSVKILEQPLHSLGGKDAK